MSSGPRIIIFFFASFVTIIKINKRAYHWGVDHLVILAALSACFDPTWATEQKPALCLWRVPL
jgi:hypothetical protein